MDTIFVLNSNKQVIDVLSNNGSNPSAPFFDDIYKAELDTGAETYEFTTLGNPRTCVTLEVGNYVLFKYNGKYKLFQIMETTDEHNEGKKLLTCYCEMAGMELLNDYCEPFSIEGNFITFLNTVLQDTNWQVGLYSASLLDNIQMVSTTEPENVYSLIQNNLATFGGVEVEFRVEFVGNQLVAMLIDCYESGTRGNRTHRRFEYGEDIKGITRNRNIADLATAVIGVGKNGLDFKDIEWDKNLGNPCDKPLQQNFVVDIEANDIWNNGGKYIKTVYKSDAETAQDLLQETWDYLQEIKQPKFDYDVDLALVAEDYLDINVGDTNYVLDFDYQPAILLEARVGTLELSFADPRNNKCTLTNYKELTSIFSRPFDLNTVGNMIQSKFPIGGEDIAMGAIGEGHIEVTYYQAIKTDIMNATLANVDTLIADLVDTEQLNAVKADIETLRANDVTITGQLTATNGNITILNSQVANIQDLIAGNTTTGDLQTIHLTADNATIDGDLPSVIEQVTTNTTNIGVMQGQISSLISNTTITKQDGTVVQLKDEYNSTKDTVNSHTTKIGSLETNYNKVSGDLASVTSKQLTLEQNLDEVSSTLTQTTTTANDALSKATSSQQNLDGFKTTVSNTYTTKTDFDNLSIGGRNFLIDTKKPKTYTLDTSTSTSNHLTKDPYKTYNYNQLSSYGFKVGDKITVSYDWKVTDVTTYGSFITELVSYDNNTSTYVGTFGNKKTVTSSETSGRIETTISLTEQMLTANKLRIRTDSAKWTFTISNVKLEKGNKATDWSPAPEDMTTKDEFNNLEIGTRNLLRNGAFLSSTDYWELASVTTLDEEMKFNGHPSIKIVCSGYTAGKYYGAVNKYLPSHVNSFLAGDTYTYSCWYYVEDTSTFDSSFRIRLRGVAEGDTNSTNRSELTVAAKDLVQGKWTKISKTMTFTKNATNCYLQPCVKQNGTIWITDVQLERGERATDWTPAPEDIDDDITVVKNSLSEVKQTADGLTTEVSKKLNSADLSSRIQQSATDIKIGFNKITNFLTIDPNNGLQVNHEDGSYTRIGAGGLELYQAYTGYRYKSLIATGSFSIKGRGTAVVTLPAQFDNVQDYEIEIFYTIETSFAGTSSMVDKTCICDMYANDLYHISFEKDSNGHWTRKVDYSLKDMCIVDGLNMHVGDFGDMSGYVHWIAFA